MELPDFKALWDDWKQQSWKPMTLPGLILCLIGCGILAIPSGRTPFGSYTVLHNFTVVPHEGGHMIVHGFFNIVSPISGGADEKPLWFPRLAPFSIAIAGTLGQLLAFFGPAAYFFYKKSPTPLGFFLFCFFANFIGIGIYMMDCRALTLDYVSYGEIDYENIGSLHDWANIFNLMHWNLGRCEALGRLARWLGWAGMAATACGWMPWMYRRTQRSAALPVAEAQAPVAGEPRAPGGSEAILVIERDPAARTSLAASLRRKGYAVLEGESLQEAMRKTAARPRPAQLLIAPFSGADASGRQAVATLRSLSPLLKAVLLLAPGDPVLIDPPMPGVGYVRQPFTDNVLALAIREVLDTPASAGLGAT
jgi:CheY-like chemotaxis protein